MAVTKELVSHWAQSYDCHCDPSSMHNVHPHHNATENGEQAYRIYVGKRPNIKYVYAV